MIEGLGTLICLVAFLFIVPFLPKWVRWLIGVISGLLVCLWIKEVTKYHRDYTKLLEKIADSKHKQMLRMSSLEDMSKIEKNKKE